MLHAIHEAGLPIMIYNPEGVRSRLLEQDNIGIIAEHDTLHRGWQRYPKEQNVFDVLPFITWEPLPILKPKSPNG